MNSPIEKIVDHIPPKIDYPLLSPKNGRDLLQVSLTFMVGLSIARKMP